jgi:hypothetical protein
MNSRSHVLVACSRFVFSFGSYSHLLNDEHRTEHEREHEPSSEHLEA